MLILFAIGAACRNFAGQRIYAMETLKTTLFLIPGGRELALPENSDKFRAAMRQAIATHTAKVLMLADTPLVPETEMQAVAKYKNVLAIESDEIYTEEDAWAIAYEEQADNYLPVVADAGYDFQVVRMEPVAVKYEDFEFLEKYI
ncbi:hypothetical protein OGH69_07415 [Flavobacterium sp. MFBS3-15]|uniref:hypothetical protein n=1 Tax=Flavobacterium sp. MFBS3-15 TaxID=2989816 RepID=UPI002235E089|nr:hypothetical protein [Flavobacterium sp. MFBS3-15]MCW4468784.1 hypothetical protein [Flavobacterium sp. MFBS3-15]